MRRDSSVFLIPVFFFGLLRGIYAEDAPPTPSKPVIVIEALGGNKAEVPCWSPALGQGVSEMLIESLESSDGKFQVLETAGSTAAPSESKADAANPAVGGKKSSKG